MRAIAAVRLALQILGAVVLTLTCSAGSALAQAGATTGLMGRVTDSSGAVVPGVTVTLTTSTPAASASSRPASTATGRHAFSLPEPIACSSS
jgi:hypothetical protein